MSIFTLDTLEQNIWRNRTMEMEMPTFSDLDSKLNEILDCTPVCIDHTINDVERILGTYQKIKESYTIELSAVTNKSSFTANKISSIEATYSDSLYETLDDHPSGVLVRTLLPINKWPAGSLAFQCHLQGSDPSLSHFFSCFFSTGTVTAQHVSNVIDEIAQGVANSILYGELKKQNNLLKKGNSLRSKTSNERKDPISQNDNPKDAHFFIVNDRSNLTDFLNKLKEEGLIHELTDKKDFRTVFRYDNNQPDKNHPYSPIIWMGIDAELKHLIQHLCMVSEAIKPKMNGKESKNKWQVVQSCFVDKKGISYTPQRLQGTGTMKKNYERLDRIAAILRGANK